MRNSILFPLPNEKQKQFFEARGRFVAYGGARGGGKSWALRHKAALLCLKYRGFRGLLLRRTYAELRENHILPMLSMLKGIAVYKETQKAFLFPNGSRLRFGYCDGEKDVLQYQGQEFDAIFLDEATMFTEYQFSVLSACMRGTNGNPKRFYLSCNPGGVGHAWVKRLFIDRDYRANERAEDYAFIPARIYDNKALIENDPGYIETLKALPEKHRKAWLDGDWDVLEGRYFTEFERDIHVCRPFEITKGWATYFAMDYGLDMLAGYWIAMDGYGDAYVYREIYESGLIISEAAKRVVGMTREDVDLYIAPPDLWNRRQDTGKSAAEIFLEHGISLYRADSARVSGWYDLKEWLKPKEKKSGEAGARLTIFENCRNLIRCLPALTHDEGNPNDVAREPHELTHAPDAIRYFVTSRPHGGREAKRDAETGQWQKLMAYGK